MQLMSNENLDINFVDSGEIISSQKSEISFIDNEGLRRVAEKLPKVPFNDKEVMRRITELVAKRGVPKEDSLVGLLAEAHVTYALEQLAAEKELGLDLYPIKTPSKSRKYVFVRKNDTGNITAIEKRGHGGLASTAMEYDGVVMIEGVVTLVDVRASAEGGSKGKRNKYSLRALRDDDLLREKLKPLKDRFPLARNFGCIAVGSREAIGKSGEREKAFAEKGMFLVPLPISLPELREHAVDLRNRILEIRAVNAGK